jgi:hypothetical protein
MTRSRAFGAPADTFVPLAVAVIAVYTAAPR